MTGVDPKAVGTVLKLDVIDGSLPSMESGRVLVDRCEADKRGLHVVDVVPVGFAKTGAQRLTVGGVFERYDLSGA